MNGLLQFPLAVLVIAWRAAYFRQPHVLLPQRVRLTSPGFVALCVAFMLAGLVRHHHVEGLSLDGTLASLAMTLCLAIVIPGSRRTASALYLAVSVGVDLTMAAAGLLGLDLHSPVAAAGSMAWELLATVAAILASRTAAARAS